MRKLALAVLLFLSLPARAGIVRVISVEGNQRVGADMIRSQLPFKEGDGADAAVLDRGLVALYGSGLFSDVRLDLGDDGVLLVRVAENIVIGAVAFEGNSAVKSDELAKNLGTRSHGLFSVHQVRRDVEAVKSLYKQLGFFRASVEAETIERPDGRRDVVFSISEGRKAYISDIEIRGNESFSRSEIIDAIMSKEYGWWKLMEMYDTYHQERIVYDADLLRVFYMSQGFLDFEMEEYGARFDDAEEDFRVYFHFDEGRRYKVGKIDVRTEISDLDVGPLREEVLLRAGRWYNNALAERTVGKMTDRLGADGFAFVAIDIERAQDREAGVVDVVFDIRNSRRAFVNRIDVRHNARTYESIIRRNLAFSEGDIFDVLALKRSEQKLMGLGYFSAVALEQKAVEGVSDKVDVEVSVAEQSTGELSMGAGWSSINKGFMEFGIKENNFMGKGQTLGFTSVFSARQNRFDFSFTEPYMWGRDLIGGTDVFYSQTKIASISGYNIDTIGLSLRLGWSYSDNLSHRWRLSAQNDRVVDVQLPPEMRAGLTDSDVYRLSHTLSYQDQVIDYVNDTRTGYSLSLSNEYAGFGGDKSFLRNTIAARQYFSFWDGEWQLGIMGEAGNIKALGGTILGQNYKYTLGGDSLRGFDYKGVAARYRGFLVYPLGGDWIVNGTFQLNFPIFIPKKYKVSGYVFYDWGKVGSPNLDVPLEVFYSSKMRTSAGYGISWNSPMGVINLSWARALAYEEYDDRQRFLFSIGSAF